jgi:hypothetical protein
VITTESLHRYLLKKYITGTIVHHSSIVQIFTSISDLCDEDGYIANKLARALIHILMLFFFSEINNFNLRCSKGDRGRSWVFASRHN